MNTMNMMNNRATIGTTIARIAMNVEKKSSSDATIEFPKPPVKKEDNARAFNVRSSTDNDVPPHNNIATVHDTKGSTSTITDPAATTPAMGASGIEIVTSILSIQG